MPLTEVSAFKNLSIVNDDINGSAAIAGSKINPTFTENVSISQDVPRLNFIDTGDNPNYQINNTNGVFKILDSSSPADRITIATDGTVTVTGNLNANAGLDVTGGDITGTLGSAVTATTQSAGDNSTKIATTAYVDGASVSTEQVQDIVGGMVSTNTETNIEVTYDDTNGKLNFASTGTNIGIGRGPNAVSVSSSTGTSQQILAASTTQAGVMTGTDKTNLDGLTSSSGVLKDGVTATTQSANDNSTKVATTAYVDNASGGGSASSLTSPDGTTKVEATNSSVEVKDSFRINDSMPLINFKNADGTTSLAQIMHSGATSGTLEIHNKISGGDVRFQSTTGSSSINKILIRKTGGGNGHPDVYIGQSMTTTEDGTGNGKPNGINALFPASGGVELYHISGSTGTKKFETTANGITVQGSVTTEDINMSNLNASANEVDNTKGSWTIQEGASDLFLINRVNGKKYKFNLTEIS